MKKDRKNLIIAIAFFALSLLLFASFISYSPYDIPFETSTPNIHIRNFIGIVGAYTAWAIFKVIGYAGFLVPILCLIWGIGISIERMSERQLSRVIGVIFLFSSSSAFLSLTAFGDSTAMVTRGGIWGFLLAGVLSNYFGILGGYIITITFAILALLVTSEFMVVPLVVLYWRRLWSLLVKAREWLGHAIQQKEKSGIKISEGPRLKPAVKMEKRPAQEKRARIEGERTEVVETKTHLAMPKPKSIAQKVKKVEPRIVGDYKMPGLDLLNEPPPESERMIGEDLQESARILEDTLRDFDIETKVVDISKGPVITRYEVQPAPGIKVNRITALSDNIALAMKATTVRIVAPIPGKSCIGIEVPNRSTSIVYLREVLESKEYQKMAESSRLAMALGKDISGKPVVANLGDMPHLLIAGTTGSGKTVCVNSLIMSMVYNATPDELKFLMVDPKMVELAIYNGLPHLLCPVVTEPKKVSSALSWVVDEMESRYKMLAKITVRNIEAFNQKSTEKLPYIVVIIDELADLMLVAQQDIESAITRLAQLSRAVGIHMILATQRPSVDVVTGVIKANFPARISFKVASKVDSRTVLDMNGADKLLGKGDMLFLEPANPKPIRAQGSFLTDGEIEKVVSFIKSQQEPVYDEEILEQPIKTRVGTENFEKDEFFDDAVKLVLETGQASVSMLQRRLRLGYTRAARLIDAMEEAGIVGPFRGSKPREILIDEYHGVTRRGQIEE